MSRLKVLGLALGALALTQLPAIAQTTKVTNDGISANEIVIGTHQDLSGPIKVWGVPVSNGMNWRSNRSTRRAASMAASCA